MVKGDRISERAPKTNAIIELTNEGVPIKEICARVGVCTSYAYAVRSRMDYGDLYEWDEVTAALKRSKRDLSKIKIVKEKERY